MIKFILFGALVVNIILLASSADTDNDYSRPPPPTENKCKKNERYVKCPSLLCQPQSCDQLGYPIACPIQGADGECPGKPGCICIDGYLRNDKGICVPQKQCPSCGGDPNAESGCGQNCGRRCSNYKQSNVVCPLICQINGCDCKKGYKFDMQDCEGVSTPLFKGKLEPNVGKSSFPYQELVGCLMYLAVNTKLDIAYTVTYLSQFNTSFGEIHWKAAKRCLQYLKNTKDFGITYRKAELDKLQAYSDAN
ncbi:uncharacterized protein LOC113236672 [Hyposmocoma kahamanoa]|uniref:uncharacterized protein LOC113236672 n=1 Tax=Hyposmocoma kahamanoa TaxID=1477025 RepID=UPI000E6D728E|nr:uncharacterized protein LOC113236672 [Hyposmocoma kahamanoa]